MEKQPEINALDLAREVALFLEEKIGEDIVLIDIKEQTFFTDYFIICSANSDRQLKALANDLARMVRDKFGIHTRPEGQPESGWMLVDLSDIIVHLFSEEKREYYQLEELWNEGQVLLRIQ